MSSRTQGLSNREPFFLHSYEEGGIVTWLIIGTVSLIMILGAASLLHAIAGYGHHR